MATFKAKPDAIVIPSEDESPPTVANVSPSDQKSVDENTSSPDVSPREHSPMQSFARRRTSSLSLRPLQISNNFTFYDGPIRTHVVNDHAGANLTEVQQEGICLYRENFLKPELLRQGLEEPESIQQALLQQTPGIKTPTGYNNPMWAKLGKEMRIMADDFRKSKEREMVQKKAKKCSLIQSYEQYCDLLTELFYQGGVTPDRLVVLFFFCSDLTIFALESRQMQYFTNLVNWTFEYIRDTLSWWVTRSGGWNAIFLSTQKYIDVAFKLCFVALSCALMISWLKRN